MNEVTLPPSPNWYLSNILTCSYNGTVAWGARNVIVIAKPKENEKILQYSIIKHAHKTKVTCLAFTPKFEEINANLIASTGDDNVIKIWDLETLSTVYTYLLEVDKQPICIDWSYKDPYVLYAAISNGSILTWNVHYHDLTSISLGKVTPTCISSSPHDPHLVAVGSKSGLVYIVNFQGGGKIVYKLRRHDTEIVSLSWCPSENNILSKNLSRDLLLASSGKDRSIFIWKAGGDGRYEMTISLPTGPLDSHQHKSKLNASVGNWVVVHWIEPKLLLASSFWGELISWDLSTMTNGKPNIKLIHEYHSRGLFCIAHVPIDQDILVQDWRTKQRHTIWTLAQDRKIICCGIKENNIEIDHDIFTQAGYVYCIAACPLDTSHVAFGVGDAMLRLWNLSTPHSTSFDITVLWQKIKGKIRAISWHPEKENLLAYATEEGRLGVFNTNNSNKPPILFRQYHRDVIYTTRWGPNPENEEFVLYSCGDGELIYYDPKKPNQESFPIIIQYLKQNHNFSYLEPKSVLKKDCTEFSWKPDFSCLVVGFKNGTISFYNRKFEKCGYAKFSTEMVHCLVWHPESTETDLALSPLKNYLAVASKSCSIVILDVSDLMNHFSKLGDSTNDDNVTEACDTYKAYKIVATLTGHVYSVVCLAWSPYTSGHLISGSYDGTAQVWNVGTQELIATYTGHSGPVLCCMWSPLDPDFIITGSADATLQIWKVTHNTPNLPKKTKKKQNKTGKVASTLAQNNSASSAVLTNGEMGSISNVPQTVQKTKSKETKTKKSEQTYFTNCTEPANDKTLLLNSLLNIVKNMRSENVNMDEIQNDTSYHIIPVLFSTQDNFMSFLTNEKTAHMEKNKYNLVTEMDMCCNNLKQNLEEAAKEKRLNDYLVSLSASLSMKTWKDMCESYAHQLITEGNFHKAVSYLLCIHKTYKAIEVFQDANLYKEAYALARCKLESDDQVLTNVLRNWAEYSVNRGNFEHAAYIYAKLGEFSNIIQYLARRKDAATLITAAEIARLCDNDIMITLVDQAIVTAITKSEYDLARLAIAKFPYFKYREVHLLTFEELEKVIQKNVNPDMIQLWIDGKTNYGLLENLHAVLEDCTSYYADLCRDSFFNTLDNEKMLWLAVSHDLAAAIACAEKEQKLKHIVTALHTVTQFETLHRKDCENHILMEILIKLDAKNVMDETSIYAKSDSSISTSLRAYLCYGLLSWLVYYIDKEVAIDNIQNCVDLIEQLLEDALNKETVKYSSITNEINKLEAQIVIAKRKSQEEDKNDENIESFKEELNSLQIEKEQIFNKLVYTPNPVMVYAKANELCSKLLDGTTKNKFSETVSKLWTNAINVNKLYI